MLNAVVDLLVEQGTPKLSTTEVAERADVAVGTFYNHFLSLDEAIGAAFDDLRLSQDELVGAASAGLEPPAAFGSFIGAFLAGLHLQPRLFRAARVAGRSIEPLPGNPVVRYLAESGVITPSSDAEIELTSKLFCLALSQMTDQLGHPDVAPQLPGQASRILAALVLDDLAIVEEVVAEAEGHYRRTIEAFDRAADPRVPHPSGRL